jgi:predicted transposase/invertase (TIGR01784 family)
LNPINFKDDLPSILPITEDGVFKSVFTSIPAIPALTELLSDILGIKLKDVTLCPNELPRLDSQSKRELFDICCVANDDKAQFDIEMQVAHMEGDSAANAHKNIRSRSIYYVSDLHAAQPGRGIPYVGLYRSFQVTICNYNVFEWDNKLAETFTYRNDLSRQLGDDTTIVYFDLTQASRLARMDAERLSDLEKWAVYLSKADDPKYLDLIDKLAKSKEGIQMAQQALTSISRDENERARFLLRRHWLMDEEHREALRRETYAENAALKSEKAALQAELAALQAENAALRAKLGS